MENTTPKPDAPETEQPNPVSPFDAMRNHVMAAKKFGYREMMMSDIIHMIDLAEQGKLGPFRSNFS